MHRVIAVGLTVGGVVWMLAMILAPLAAAHGVASPVVVLVYEAAGLVCHQRPDRSFHIAGTPLPVCARCLGLYASGAAGSLIAWFESADILAVQRRTARIVLATAALPTALTVAAEWLGLLRPSSVTRAVCALPLGAAVGWMFVRMLRAETGDLTAAAKSPADAL
jgi:uncharacterized membrane protein